MIAFLLACPGGIVTIAGPPMLVGTVRPFEIRFLDPGVQSYAFTFG